MNELYEQLDDVERNLVEEVLKGEEIKDGQTKPIFQLLFRTAKEAAIAARNALVAADADDSKHVRYLQNEVKRYEEMADWIRTAVTKGENAFKQLEVYRGDNTETVQQE